MDDAIWRHSMLQSYISILPRFQRIKVDKVNKLVDNKYSSIGSSIKEAMQKLSEGKKQVDIMIDTLLLEEKQQYEKGVNELNQATTLSQSFKEILEKLTAQVNEGRENLQRLRKEKEEKMDLLKKINLSTRRMITVKHFNNASCSNLSGSTTYRNRSLDQKNSPDGRKFKQRPRINRDMSAFRLSSVKCEIETPDDYLERLQNENKRLVQKVLLRQNHLNELSSFLSSCVQAYFKEERRRSNSVDSRQQQRVPVDKVLIIQAYFKKLSRQSFKDIDIQGLKHFPL